MLKKDLSSCATCPYDWPQRYCRGEGGKGPGNCPSLRRDLAEEAKKIVAEPTIRQFSKQCSIQESRAYGDRELGYEHVNPIKPRIQEIIEFAGRMQYKRLGLIFCVGLRREAAIVHGLFEAGVISE